MKETGPSQLGKRMVPTIGRGTSLVKPHWRPNDAVKFPITLLLGAFPAN